MKYHGHNRFGILFLAGTILLALYLDVGVLNRYGLVFVLSYLFSLVALSPDMDVNSRPYHNWGAARVLWTPYKRLHRHRGSSHSIRGSILRVAYFAFLVCIVLLAVGVSRVGIVGVAKTSYVYLLLFVVASLLASFQHITADRINYI